MRPKLILTVAVLVLAVIIVLPIRGALAQAPSAATVPYPGHLSNDTGGPVANGAYDFSFALYDAADGGSQVWSEAQSQVPVQAGAFTVNLGSVQPLPAAAALNKLWLEIRLRGPAEGAFTLLTPRQAMSNILPPAVAKVNGLTGGGSCAHTHFGESWTGDSPATSYGSGLTITDTRLGGTGILGIAMNGTDASGVSGESNAGIGVYGSSSSSAGVYGSSSTGAGVTGDSTSSQGVFGYSAYNDGIKGQSNATGYSGVHGHADNGFGVAGDTSSTNVGISGVQGENSGAGAGVSGLGHAATSDWSSSSGAGVVGHSYGIGANAGYFESTGGDGAFIKADNSSTYWGAVIVGGLDLINGGCGGCALVYTGLNGGTTDIPTGSLVAVAGVKVDATTQQPVLLVKTAALPEDIIIGVAVSAAADPAEAGQKGPDVATDSIAPGKYVRVLVGGLAQVKVSGKVAIGAYLAPATSGNAVASTQQSPVRVMSDVDENGMVWVMVVGR